MFRFVYVKGIEMDDELGVVLVWFNGRCEKKFGFDWWDYILVWLVEEI